MAGIQVGYKQDKSKYSSTVNDAQDPYYQALRYDVASKYRPILQGGLDAVPKFEGPLVTPITSGEQAALGSAMEFDPTNPLHKAITQSWNDTNAGRYLRPETNPALQASYQRAVNPALQYGDVRAAENAPNANTPAANPFSDISAARTADRANLSADSAGRFYGRNYTAERGRMGEALTAGGQYGLQDAALKFDTLTKQLHVAALPRLIQDLGYQRGLEEYQARTDFLKSTILAALGGTQPQIVNDTKGSGFGFGVSVAKSAEGGTPSGGGGGGGGTSGGGGSISDYLGM